MISVSSNTRDEYFAGYGNKELYVSFPELNIVYTNRNFVTESMELKESILDKDSMEFVGCIPSQFKIQITGEVPDLRGKKIEVILTNKETTIDTISLFKGTVESCDYSGNKNRTEVVAYDALYSLSEKNIYDWFTDYLVRVTHKTIKNFRDSLFEYLEIYQVERRLPNDNISIQRIGDVISSIDSEDDNSIMALDVLKNICQINGVFGIMTRGGKFDYRKIGTGESKDDGAYPGAELIPPFFPGIGTISVPTEATFMPHYKSIDYVDYSVHEITKVAVRQQKGSKSRKAGTGSYRYFVQGNMFTVGLDNDQKDSIANGVLSNVSDISYKPFTARNVGLPFLEVGDIVNYYVYNFTESSEATSYKMISFYILSRTLKGIQSLEDVYSASGEEKQKTFISDMGFRDIVSTEELNDKVIKNTDDISKNTRELSDHEGRISDLENAEGLQVLSVTSLPPDASQHPNTIYLIQGTVG